MRILIDMNLSPEWVAVLARHRFHAIHWSSVGDIRAADRAIMEWALANDYAIFTHDLDFGTILALTHDQGPSVIQYRGQDVLPSQIESLIVSAIRQHESDLISGALLVIDENKQRVRILPIR